MLKKITLIIIVLSLLFIIDTNPLMANDNGTKLLKKLFDYNFRKCNDFVTDIKVIAHINKKIINTEGKFFYKDSGLIKIDYIGKTGFTSLVMNLNSKKGFYFMKDGRIVIEFNGKENGKKLKKGDFKTLLFDFLTDLPLKIERNKSSYIITSVGGNNFINYRIYFDKKSKNIKKFIKYNQDGKIILFVKFSNFKNKKLSLKLFDIPQYKTKLKMRYKEGDPFQYIKF